MPTAAVIQPPEQTTYWVWRVYAPVALPTKKYAKPLGQKIP